MLKRTIIPALIAIFALAACSKEFENPGFGREASTEVHSLSVGIEAGSYLPADETKATMEAIVRVYWKKGDEVSVVNATTGELLNGKLTADADGEIVTFSGVVSGTINPADVLYYIYPAIDDATAGTFTEHEISLKNQVYDKNDTTSVCFHGYARDIASSGNISKRIKFDLVTAYVHLNMSNLPAAGKDLTSVDLSNVNGGFKWVCKQGEGVTAEPCFENQGISVTCQNTTISQKGNAIVRFAVPASPETTDARELTVNKAYINTNYTKAARQSAYYYNQIYSTWKQVVEAETVAAANEAFARGETMVKIKSVGEEETLYLPQTTEDVTIDFADPEKIVTVKYGPAPDAEPATKAAITGKPATVNIATNDITKFTVTGIDNVVWLAGNGTALYNAVTNAKSGQTVALTDDIDFDGTTWESPVLNADFNGNGHIIKNIKNPSCAPDYAGLFKISYSNIKNVTIQNAEFAYGETMNARGGALVGDMRRGSIENCHVDGIKFDGYQKVGGLVGFLSKNDDNGSDISIKNCSVKNATFAACGADDKYLYQTGGLIGYIQLGNRNISISNCSVNHIIFDNTKHKGVYNVASDNSGYLSHTFVGIIFSDTNNAANTLSFTANTISGENTQLNASMYGSAYFGWARNPEYKPTKAVTLGKITIDGEEWTPNYPFKNVTTGKGYATLDAALTALKASETLEIWEAGEYTVQTLSTPANTTIDAKVDGVVFNRTPGGWVANQIDGRTVKNITWNVGSANYQYFHGVNLVNCKVNGLLITHSNNTYTDCEFYNADEYNFWEYGSGSTFTGCKFTCPGDTKGAVNAYNEGEQGIKKVVFENCEFVALNESTKYAAVYIKPESSFDIEFTNCTANDKFCTGDKSGSKLWNVKAHTNLNTKVTVDGKLVYANGTVLDITTADQLMAFAAAVNSGKNFDNTTVTLGADIDMTGKAWIPIGNVNDYPGKAFYGVFDGQNHIVSNLTCTDNTENYACAGFFGSIMGTVKNLTLKNVNISSNHYAAGIVAYCSSSDLDVENCHVIGGTITSTPELLVSGYDNGDKAGGIVGLAAEVGKITGCTVDGVTIRAFRDLGGILGAGNSIISNCVVKNSSVIQDNTNAYKTGIDTYHEILGRNMGATLYSNTFENVTVKSEN